MPHTPEAQRAAAVRKLTSELYLLQDRMNQAIDEITRLLHGVDASSVGSGALVGVSQSQDGAIERTLRPSALSQPLPSVFVDNPPTGFLVGVNGECKFFSDYRNGQLQLVQVPAHRGTDERYALLINYASFDASYLSLVHDARALLADLPPGRLRVTLAVEYRSEPPVKLHAKFAFKVGDHWGEHHLQLKGTRVLVDTFEVPMIDPATIEALDFHLIFSPGGRGCIELHRATFSVSLLPNAEHASPDDVFENAH